MVNGLDDSFLVRPAAAARPGGGRTLHLCLLRKPLEGAYEALFEELPALAGGFERVVYWDCVPKLFDRNIRKLRVAAAADGGDRLRPTLVLKDPCR